MFSDCTSLETITIPSNVKTLDGTLFDGCTSLKSVIIKGACETSYGIFQNCSPDYVIFEDPSITFHEKTFEKSNIGTVYCQPQLLNTIAKIRNGNVCTIGAPYFIDVNSIVSKPRSISFKLSNSIYSEDQTTLSEVNVNGETCQKTTDDTYLCTGLKPQQGISASIYITKNGKDEAYQTQTIYASDHEWEVKSYGGSNTTIKKMVKVTGDDHYEVEECGLYFNKNYYPAIERNTWDGILPIAIVDKLAPGKLYTFKCYVKYTDGEIFIGKEIQDAPYIPNLGIKNISGGPTSIKLRGLISGIDDAHIEARGFEVDGISLEKDSLYLIRNDWEPETSYAVKYWVKLQESPDKFYTSTTKITTPAPTFETQQAKATSETSVILSANTNLETTVTKAGFEWRRYDAPAELPSTKVACAVVDNQLMGSLRNLKSEIYYKYRPYYTTASGKSYYGEWVAFIAGDASVYFEPITRTYAVAEITENTAQVSGAVVAGTDNIIEQGFEYWKTATVQTRAAGSNVKTVKASGQMMTATLSGLEPGTAYSYRVYAKTANGTTYGEEQKFTTGGTPTGIKTIATTTDDNIAIKGSLNAALSVKTDASASTALWEIINMNGKTIDRGHVSSNGNWTEIHHKPLDRGIYLVRITTKQITKTYKQVAK